MLTCVQEPSFVLKRECGFPASTSIYQQPVLFKPTISLRLELAVKYQFALLYL